MTTTILQLAPAMALSTDAADSFSELRRTKTPRNADGTTRVTVRGDGTPASFDAILSMIAAANQPIAPVAEVRVDGQASMRTALPIKNSDSLTESSGKPNRTSTQAILNVVLTAVDGVAPDGERPAGVQGTDPLGSKGDTTGARGDAIPRPAFHGESPENPLAPGGATTNSSGGVPVPSDTAETSWNVSENPPSVRGTIQSAGTAADCQPDSTSVQKNFSTEEPPAKPLAEINVAKPAGLGGSVLSPIALPESGRVDPQVRAFTSARTDLGGTDRLRYGTVLSGPTHGRAAGRAETTPGSNALTGNAPANDVRPNNADPVMDQAVTNQLASNVVLVSNPDAGGRPSSAVGRNGKILELRPTAMNPGRSRHEATLPIGPEALSAAYQPATNSPANDSAFEHLAAAVTRQLSADTVPESQSIRLRLDPPKLGTVNVHLSVVHDVVSIRLVASGEAARQMLEGQLNELRQSLTDHGVSFGSCHVECEAGGQQSFPRRHPLPPADDTPFQKSTPRPSLRDSIIAQTPSLPPTRLNYVA